MEHDESAGPAPNSSEQLRNQQVDNAIRAIQQKKPLPEIDFTIHVMEDGTQVNTQERVCKGTSDRYLVSALFCLGCLHLLGTAMSRIVSLSLEQAYSPAGLLAS